MLSYLPYVFFRLFNNDLTSIEELINKDEENKFNAERITEKYFNYFANGGKSMLRMRVLANFLLKFMYLNINVGGFYFTNNLLNRR